MSGQPCGSYYPGRKTGVNAGGGAAPASDPLESVRGRHEGAGLMLNRTRRMAAALAVIALGAVPARAVPAPRYGTVLLPSGRVLQVELAETPEQLARGYMYREEVPEGQGMLFFMGTLDFHPFWMKNCKVGLDILWLDEQWKVVHIERELPPCKADPCPDYMPMQASLYVLEMRAGASAREGIKLGDRIQYVPPRPAK